MRFTRENWEKLFSANKITTIRLKPHREGTHNAWAGSYMKPVKLGEFDVTDVVAIRFKDLNLSDALDDGFPTLEALLKELTRLNGRIKPEQVVYQHLIENAKRVG